MKDQEKNTDHQEKKAYRAPMLTRFGEVRALTQAQSGCNMADNPGCTSGVSVMGVMV